LFYILFYAFRVLVGGLNDWGFRNVIYEGYGYFLLGISYIGGEYVIGYIIYSYFFIK
jgi:hypothetical protein